MLDADDNSEVVIEGITEDIEIHSKQGLEAIQCKYHESKEKFSFSSIYKPILQMFEDYCIRSKSKIGVDTINYRLFCHFPSQEGEISITEKELDQALSSNNKDLAALIERIGALTDRLGFISKVSIQFGPSYDDISDEVQNKLIEAGFARLDVPAIFYPTAVHRIAEAATRTDLAARTFKKGIFIKELAQIKKVTLSRWTREIKTQNEIFMRYRAQLHDNLSMNSRLRYFVINSNLIEDFDKEIVIFIKEYLEHYSFKRLHDKTPLFALLCSANELEDLKIRLWERGLKFEDGMVNSGKFNSAKLHQDNIMTYPDKTSIKRSFDIRICGSDHIDFINLIKPDDLFLIADPDFTDKNLQDINVERLCVSNLNELKFLLGIRKML